MKMNDAGQIVMDVDAKDFADAATKTLRGGLSKNHQHIGINPIKKSNLRKKTYYIVNSMAVNCPN